MSTEGEKNLWYSNWFWLMIWQVEQITLTHCLILPAFCLIFQTTSSHMFDIFMGFVTNIWTFYSNFDLILLKKYHVGPKFTLRKSAFERILEIKVAVIKQCVIAPFSFEKSTIFSHSVNLSHNKIRSILYVFIAGFFHKSGYCNSAPLPDLKKCIPFLIQRIKGTLSFFFFRVPTCWLRWALPKKKYAILSFLINYRVGVFPLLKH